MSETSTLKKSRERPLQYAQGGLDRAAHLREDDAGFEQALSDPEARLVPVWRDRSHLAEPADSGAPVAGRLPISLHREADEVVLLGLEAGRPVFAGDFSSLDEERALALGGGEFVDLRRVGPLLSAPDAALLAYARGILHWHRNHAFCGRCGARTRACRAGHLRKCSNLDCARPAFPRTDPAMIVLVLDRDETHCLLGRARNWPESAYSTLAGFVEPGESLEATVRREVAEESGIDVGEVRYVASQPWPFPSSLMIGFHAVAETFDIQRHDEELVDAGWYSADQVRAAGEWDDPEAELCLPRPDSIARYLIEEWLDRHR